MADDIPQLRAQLAAITAERDRLAFGPPLDAALAAMNIAVAYRPAVKALFVRHGYARASRQSRKGNA